MPYCLVDVSYMNFETGIGYPVLRLLVQLIAWVSLLIICQCPLWRNITRIAVLKTQAITQQIVQTGTGIASIPMGTLGYSRANEDADVSTERQRLWSRTIDELRQTEAVLIMGLTKYYGTHAAVDNISIGVPHGECFGLLGTNGAGKTTVFHILTGGRRLSAGQVYLNGHCVLKQLSLVSCLILPYS